MGEGAVEIHVLENAGHCKYMFSKYKAICVKGFCSLLLLGQKTFFLCLLCPTLILKCASLMLWQRLLGKRDVYKDLVLKELRRNGMFFSQKNN